MEGRESALVSEEGWPPQAHQGDRQPATQMKGSDMSEMGNEVAQLHNQDGNGMASGQGQAKPFG